MKNGFDLKICFGCWSLEVNNRHRMKVSSLSTSVAQIRDNDVAQSDIVETKPALKE